MAWGLCGQMSLAALMGVSLDHLRSVWRGDASQGTCMEDMLRFVRGYCEVSAFSTTRYDRDTLIIHADGLQWPICGLVAVTLPDGEPHWVATLNGLIYDCLQDDMLDVIEWDRRNRPYTIDDVIITGPGILSLPNPVFPPVRSAARVARHAAGAPCHRRGQGRRAGCRQPDCRGENHATDAALDECRGRVAHRAPLIRAHLV